MEISAIWADKMYDNMKKYMKREDFSDFTLTSPESGVSVQM